MVTGRVTDKNTGAGLTRATVSFGAATAATATAADDTAQGDGFYQMAAWAVTLLTASGIPTASRPASRAPAPGAQPGNGSWHRGRP